MHIIAKFVDPSSEEYEKCRVQISNSTILKLRHRIAGLLSDLFIYARHPAPFHATFISTAEWLWSIVGTSWC